MLINREVLREKGVGHGSRPMCDCLVINPSLPPCAPARSDCSSAKVAHVRCSPYVGCSSLRPIHLS